MEALTVECAVLFADLPPGVIEKCCAFGTGVGACNVVGVNIAVGVAVTNSCPLARDAVHLDLSVVGELTDDTRTVGFVAHVEVAAFSLYIIGGRGGSRSGDGEPVGH